jgi:hypothetical protein
MADDQGFPQINSPLVDPKTGTVTQVWLKLIIALWNRTGGGTGHSTTYIPSDVQITGGDINGTKIGNLVPAEGTFTTLRGTINLAAANFSGSSSGVNTGDQTNITGTAGAANALNSATTTINVSAATAPSSGDVLTATDSTHATWQTPVSGSVSSVSVVSANGLAGTVATATTTPAITLSTTITGVLKGNGTAISAATSGTDYSLGTSALSTGILKSTTTTGALTIAVAGDFPTLNQNTTGSSANLVVEPSPATSVANGITASLTAGENLVFGDIVYMKSDGKVWKGDANGASTYPVMGFATASITANNDGVILLFGIATLSSWAWTVGGVLYLSTTAGGITQTQPSATDDVIQVIGIAKSATTIIFNPSYNYITHA